MSTREQAEPKAASPAVANAQQLPAYSRSLLKIQVPVVVTLAATRSKVKEVIRLRPGSIIQFEKSCEDMLELEVGGLPIALGEAVKIGDKFGLRITSMDVSGERFESVAKLTAAQKHVG